MDAVEELREVDIDHHPVSVADILLRLGDRRVRPTCRPESVAARMQGRREDRLQNLEHGLLNPPIDHVRDAQTAFPSAWPGNPNPADVARPVRPVQQRTLQTRQKRPGGAQDFVHAASVHARSALVANNVQQGRRQIRWRRHCLQQPTCTGRPGAEIVRRPAVRCVQQEVSAGGCVRRS